MRAFDSSTARQAFAGPGNDTRIWVSFGTVDPDTPDQRSVTFSPTYGPLVNVTLRPHGIPAVCRVSHEVAGNGEGEYFPFVQYDEVIVLIPEGDEHAGCTIVGRLNQEIDQFPTLVAGMDPTQNNFAFRRMRTPYVIETASNYLIRDATTGAFISLNSGTITLANGDQAYLSISPDFIGLQTADASTLMQLDVAAQQVILQAGNATKLVLDANSSAFASSGTLALATSGNQPLGHAISFEAVVALLAGLGAASPGPMTGATFLAGLLAAIPVMGTTPLAPYTASMLAALQTPATVGAAPTPGLLIG